MIRSFFILGSFLCGSSLADKAFEVGVIDHAVNNTVNGLLDMYIDDCKNNEEAHGYYSALFQPCNFKFLESTGDDEDVADGSDACSDEKSTQLLETAPVNWIFNLTQKIADFDWTEMKDEEESSIDFAAALAKDLVLWPDQCVGVAPRCYAVNDEKIRDVVEIIFQEKGFPETATHVSVDCRSDALELSRLAYGFTSGLGKSSTTIFAWLLTVFFLTLVLSCYCCLCCFRLCCCSGRRGDGDARSYRRRLPRASKYAQIASAEIVDDLTVTSDHYSDSESGRIKKRSAL